jgi:phosphoribosyl 1,2-cyclic phosphodiesterase
VHGQDPIVLDLGTGLRFWGETLAADGSFRGTALVTHLHWDHVQGLPFFTPVDRPGACLDIYGPTQEEGSLGQVFDDLMRPPYFPVRAAELRGKIQFHDVNEGDIAIGSAKVKVCRVPHPGPTVGYRIDWDGVSIAYVSDHQGPPDHWTVDRDVLELCHGVDLLIHDAQYTDAEWDQKSHWGHCTTDFAVAVAAQARARRLVLFHHDPARSDDEVDRLLKEAQDKATEYGVDEVVAAAEGLTISYD